MIYLAVKVVNAELKFKLLLLFGNLIFINIISKSTNLKMLYRCIKIHHYDVICLIVNLEQNKILRLFSYGINTSTLKVYTQKLWFFIPPTCGYLVIVNRSAVMDNRPANDNVIKIWLVKSGEIFGGISDYFCPLCEGYFSIR